MSKILGVKSLWKFRKLSALLIFVMKTGGFLIRSLAKVVRKSSDWKSEKQKTSVFLGPQNLNQNFSKFDF